MESLDEQLAKLQLINSRELSPKTSYLATINSNDPQQHQTSSLLLKKVGPAVPPKPKKSQNQIDLPTGSGPQHVYSNSQVTLDNSVELQIKKEALEHHKKVLEARKLKEQQQQRYLSNSDDDDKQPPLIYENIHHNQNNLNRHRPPQEQQLIYSNLHLNPNIKAQQHYDESQQNQNNYSNLIYGNEQADDLPPPPPQDLHLTLTCDLTPTGNVVPGNSQIQTGLDEDNFPPPPSPVSSSYSELRRATDCYPLQQNVGYSLAGISNDDNGGNGPNAQQIYANNGYHHHQHHHPEYLGYGVVNSGGGNGDGISGNGVNIIPSSQSINSDYYGYGSSTQGSTTYESIYEPINPRPNSQMSSRSNYSLYTSNLSEAQSGGQNVDPLTGEKVLAQPHKHKESEVDVLTNLLVQSMDSHQDSDSYGVCVKCGERVVGENSGCTAMEQIYHIVCFTCNQCQINLQGKPFYALEGKPYCEEDYLNTLEKCSVCLKPILERILRATGKPYHPQCFCCIVCGKSLDGIPFTVDATNQIHCIEDFHKKFAPRCCVCRLPIMPEPGEDETVRVVALDRSFHIACYKCEDCGLLLSSEADGRGCYPLDDHVLCKSCNAKRVQTLTSHMTTEL